MNKYVFSRKGFTLIELLIVIAIIAILAAVLFPVFAAAREKARQTSCASNLKQISLAVLQYCQDYDEFFPLQNDLKGVPVSGMFECAGSNTTNGFYYSWPDRIYSYVQSQGVFQCPDGATNGDGVAQTTSKYCQYGLNVFLSQYANGITSLGGTAGVFNTYPLAKVARPDSIIMATDYSGHGGTQVGQEGVNLSYGTGSDQAEWRSGTVCISQAAVDSGWAGHPSQGIPGVERADNLCRVRRHYRHAVEIDDVITDLSFQGGAAVDACFGPLIGPGGSDRKVAAEGDFRVVASPFQNGSLTLFEPVATDLNQRSAPATYETGQGKTTFQAVVSLPKPYAAKSLRQVADPEADATSSGYVVMFALPRNPSLTLRPGERFRFDASVILSNPVGNHAAARLPWHSKDPSDSMTQDTYTEALLRPMNWGIAILE